MGSVRFVKANEIRDVPDPVRWNMKPAPGPFRQRLIDADDRADTSDRGPIKPYRTFLGSIEAEMVMPDDRGMRRKKRRYRRKEN